MKTLKKYRIKSAYGVYRKGDIITPTGMLRDELLMCGRIEEVIDPPAVVVVAEPDPEPDEPEAAVMPEPEIATSRAARRRGRSQYAG